MRVLFVSAHFPPHVGGVETYTETLARGLVERGHGVTVVCCRTDPRSPLIEEGQYGVLRVPSLTWPEEHAGVPYPIPAPGQLRRALASALRDADVVHVQDVVYASSIAALLLARRAGVPSLVTQHVGFVPQGKRLLDGVQRAALAAAGPIARRATRVVAYNSEVAAWAERLWRIDRVSVEPVGVQPAHDVSPARKEFGLAPDRFVALFVGRDVPKKSLDLFLDAADPAYDLVAVTDRSGSDGRARLLPFMTPERLARLLASVDALVVPSEAAAEGVPLVLQEAMSHGLPVVTTFSAGYGASFDRDDVLAVKRSSSDVRRGLLALVADEALRARLSDRSRTVATGRFGNDRFVERMLELYGELARYG